MLSYAESKLGIKTHHTQSLNSLLFTYTQRITCEKSALAAEDHLVQLRKRTQIHFSYFCTSLEVIQPYASVPSLKYTLKYRVYLFVTFLARTDIDWQIRFLLCLSAGDISDLVSWQAPRNYKDSKRLFQPQ